MNLRICRLLLWSACFSGSLIARAQVIQSIEWLSAAPKPKGLDQLVGKDMQSAEFVTAVKLLKSTDEYQDVDFRYTEGRLVVTAHEKHYLSAIVWNFPKGVFPTYVERDLVSQLDLHETDPVPDDLAERRTRLNARLHARGYRDYDLKLTFEGTEEHRSVVADFLPSGQPREVFSHLSFMGIDDRDLLRSIARRFTQLPSLDAKNFRWVGRDYVANPCCFSRDDIEFDEFRQSLRKLMRGRGFLNFDIEVQPDGQRGLQLSARNLRRFEFQFEGQTFFWENELRTHLLENLSDRNFEIEEAKALVQDLYLKKGYRDVEITPELSIKGSLYKITFRIQENKQFFFKSVDFRNVRDEYLPLLRAAEKEWIEPFRSPFRRTYFDEQGLKSTLGILIERIRARGFLDIEVSDYGFYLPPNSRFALLKMSLRLGPRYQYSKFVITEDRPLLPAAASIKLPKPNDFFDGDRLQEITRELKRVYQDDGYLYSEITSANDKVLTKNSLLNTVEAHLQIRRGPQVFLRELKIHGYAKTRKKVITREMGDGAIELGEKLTPQRLREYENRLHGTGLFSTVDLKPLGSGVEFQGEKTLVDYDLALKERAGGSIEFGPGFRTDLGLVGFAEFAYRNIGGWNRGIFVKTTVSHKLQHYQFLEQDYSASFVEPFPFNYRSSLRFDVRYIKHDDLQYSHGAPTAGFNTEETILATRLEKRFTEHFNTITTLFTYSLPRNFNIVSVTPESTQKYRLGGNGIEFLVDYRDDIFNPLTGWFINEQVEYFSPYLASNRGVHFITSKTRFNKYFNLGHQAVFAVSLGYDHLLGLGQDSIIPENKRLTLGGESSLRFLPENFLRADELGVGEERAILGRFEYRMPLFLDFGLASFFELGKLDVLREQGALGPHSTGLRTGAGFGVRYKTPVGPLAVDWAYNFNAHKDESDYQVNLSIGTF